MSKVKVLGQSENGIRLRRDLEVTIRVSFILSVMGVIDGL